MSNLERFYEDKNFDVVSKARNAKVVEDVLISVSSKDAKEERLSIGISITSLAISKMNFRRGDKSIKLVPIIQPNTKRLYLVEDSSGYSFTNTDYRGERVWSASKPLYEKFVREYGFRRAVDGKLKWDGDLQAYYVEVN